MANPQLENSYFRIATEIAQAFMRINLSPQESRILWAIIRETYGWRKKEREITLDRLSELTGMSKPHVCHALRKLENRKIIAKKDGKISLQKDYEQWEGIKLPLADSLPEQATPIAQTGNPEGQKLPKQAIKLPKQAINIAQTGNKKSKSSKSANKKQGDSAAIKHSDITDNITDNTYGQPEKNKKTISYPNFKKELIEYINVATEKNFPIVSKVTDKFLKPRYSEGRTVEECKLVIDNRVKRWLKDPERYQYLRPSTFFRPTNFENWLIEARAEQAREIANRKAEERYEKLKKESAERAQRDLAEKARKRGQSG